MHHFTPIKTGLAALVLLAGVVFSASAHTYVATYINDNADCICIGAADETNNIYVSVNGGTAVLFMYQSDDYAGNHLYRNNGDVISISGNAQTLICGNIYTGQTFIFHLSGVNKIN